MTDKKNKKSQPAADTQAAEAPEVMDILENEDGNSSETEVEEVEAAADLTAQLDEARAAIEKEKKEYLFLMADFDNYRKRVTREKAEMLKNAGEKVLAGILPIVDDFERGLEASAKLEDPSSIREGMELIYQKLVKFLASNGVKPIESNGRPFDAELHEAIAMVPVADESQKGIVIDTPTKGYTINDKVLRHAKVAVGQ